MLTRRTLNGALVEACHITEPMKVCLLVFTLISSLTEVTAQSWPKHYNPFFEGGVGCAAFNLGSKSVSEYKGLANVSGHGLLVSFAHRVCCCVSYYLLKLGVVHSEEVVKNLKDRLNDCLPRCLPSL